MRKFFTVLLCGIIVSGFFFPFGFTFLPASLNTKQMIGVGGILIFLITSYKNGEMSFKKEIIVSLLMAFVFSLICYYTAVIHSTGDDSYSQYFISFFVWLGGAYGVCGLLKHYYGNVSLSLVTKYLAGVCVVQCALAMVIDNVPAFKDIVDAYIQQGQEFLNAVDRLYGIGASLDNAGVRFCMVEVLIAHQICFNKEVRNSNKSIALYITALFITLLIGCMISRTTTIGGAIALGYMFIFIGKSKRGYLDRRQLNFYKILISLLIVGISVSVFLYNTNDSFHGSMRFAFEGFFNWAETGEFRTDSTDKLNGEMWIWPQDFDTWMIGSGWFGGFRYGTDVGYCRFTLYCGLIGFSVFVVFFIYNAIVLYLKWEDSQFLALCFLALTFIIWVKVATDIFFIYALIYCVDSEYDEIEPPDEEADTDTDFIANSITT